MVHRVSVLEKHLQEMVNDFKVKTRGCAILMNCKTGAVYGMAQYPSFDLNQPYEISDKVVAEEIKQITDKTEADKRTKEERFETTSIRKELEEIKSLDEKRYWEVVSFLNDYSASIAHVADTVRKGGVVCYVVGDRRVKNVQIPLDFFTAEMFMAHGFKHQITLVREIPNKRMPSKTSPSNVAGEQVSTMSHEFIVILQKAS